MTPQPFAFVWGCLLGLAATLNCVPSRAEDATGWIDDAGIRRGMPLVVLPPAAGAVIGLDERLKTNSYVQTITLRGDPGTVGENQIVVTVTRDGLAPRIEQNAVAAETASRLPDMPLALGPTGTQNIFGVFGSVTGSKGRLACLYGWQGVNLADRWIADQDATPFDERHALSIRVRLCRTTASPTDLIALLEAARSGVHGSRRSRTTLFGGDPLDAMAGLTDGEIALPSLLVRPAPRSVVDVEPSARAPKPRRAHVARRRPAVSPVEADVPQPQRVPMAGMPAVPLP